MIRGWFMDIRSWRGRDGIRILESGSADRICHSVSGSELGGGAVLDGDGVIGDSIGITITPCLTTADITRGAERFITEPISGVAEGSTVAGVVSTVPEVGPGRSMEIGRRLGDTLHRVARAGCARAPSAVTTTADRPAAFRHAAAPASVAEGFTAVEDSTAAAVGEGNRNYVAFRVVCRILKWRDALCSEPI
jgi:hypothetical protein